jgi:tight adherence protein B
MITTIVFLCFCVVAFFVYIVVPMVATTASTASQQRAHALSQKLDRVLPKEKIRLINQLYLLAPLAGAGGAFAFFPQEIRVFGVVFGVLIGFFLPNFYTKLLITQNKKKFDDQLIDALMIMSSSFRGGLSLVQAMEAVVEEMPDPINQEFMTVLGENKMGVALEEALNHLYYRMPSSALQQMITAILLARETGGNLPAIFSRIVYVIREYKRIQAQIETLTIQGKIQGVVMSMLPVGFFVIVYSSNPRFFNHMLVSKVGQAMLIYACISQTIGAFLIWKISTYKDY